MSVETHAIGDLGARELPGKFRVGHDPGLRGLRRLSHHHLGTGFELTHESERNAEPDYSRVKTNEFHSASFRDKVFHEDGYVPHLRERGF